MPLRIKCPTGHTLIVPDDRAGRTLQCPRCDQPVVVPTGEDDAAGRALLSVLAEGIPAANLAAGSLPVAPAESRSEPGTLQMEEMRPPSIPLKPPFPKSHAAPAPIVKPKSRALPSPPMPRAEPAQPQPEPVEPILESPKPALPEGEPAFVAHAAAVAPPCPIAETIAEPLSPPPVAAAEPENAPPIAVDPPAPPPFVPRMQDPVTVDLNADAARTLAVYQLAAALVCAALFSVIPAVWDVVEYLRFAESPLVARWALGLFFLGVVQLAYAVYLFQLPDWTTVWVVTLFSLALAAVYAAALGLVLLSPADGFVVGNHGLQLADKLAGGKAALWCLCMVSLSIIVAFFAGRHSTRWYKAEMMLRTTAL